MSHKRHRPMGGMPSVGVFLRNPCPYLSKLHAMNLLFTWSKIKLKIQFALRCCITGKKKCLIATYFISKRHERCHSSNKCFFFKVMHTTAEKNTEMFSILLFCRIFSKILYWLLLDLGHVRHIIFLDLFIESFITKVIKLRITS